MKKFCNYHPTRAAHWSCGQCGTDLCPECVSQRDSGGCGQNTILHFCPKCNLPCEWAGVANLIEPFWKRIPRIFIYPFAAVPLILICVMAFASLLLQEVPGLIMLLIRGAIYLLVLKYAFEALKATAKGNLRPPDFTSHAIFEDFSLLFKQGGIFIAIGLIDFYIMLNYGFILALAFLLIALFFVPSMIILLVTNNRLLHALNPAAFVGLAFRIGWPYVLMYFFLALLFFAPNYLVPYIIEFFPPKMHFMLYELAKNFYLIVSYHLMGYVILQYHERIGYVVEFADFSDPSAEAHATQRADPDAPVFSAVNPLIQDGKLDEAIAQIQAMTQTRAISSANLSERYYNLLKMRKRAKDLVEHGVRHLDMLVAKNEKAKALKVYAECSKIQPEFLPRAAALFKLASWLNESGKIKAALGTYNRLIKSYPQSPMVPKTYFRVAQIFHDRLMNTEKARAMLWALQKKYPGHDIIPQVKNYLANI